MQTPRVVSFAGFSAFFLLLWPTLSPAQQKTLAPPEFVGWLPISPAEQQMKNPAVEKDAGAEVLFWRVHIVDEILSNLDIQRVFYHYVRLKVFDDKGKEKASTIDLPYGDHGAILDVSGRTVKADGTVAELDKKTIYRRDVVRVGGRKEKAVSFAMPGVEPGAIVEYRWRETVDDNRIMYVRLQFQREFPVEKVTYFFRPLPREYTAGYEMHFIPFNCKPTPVKIENDGYSSISVDNVPALRDEPFMPSAPNLSAWALLFYEMGNRNNPEKYWADIGKKGYQSLKDALKSNDEMKAAAAQATAAAKDDEAKVVALIAVVRKQVRDVFDPAVTDAEREKFFKEAPKDRRRTAADIFKRGLGTANDMNVVFAALAQQAGLDARPAWVANRGEILFNPKSLVDEYFLNNIDMAVKLGGAWRIFDVSAKLLPPGMISWREEGMYALIGDPKNPSFIQTPPAPPEASAELRTAQMKLTLDGSLEGDVQETYTGHRAEDDRAVLKDKSPAQREEWLRDRITRMFPEAEVTAVQIENADEPTRQFTTHYHLQAPRYAQVTGKRILFETNPFHRSQVSPFSASERRYAVEFPYAWEEFDQIHIHLPDGWVLDNPESPGNITFGDSGGYEVELIINKKDNDLLASRKLTFGRSGAIFVPQSNYPIVKKVFDQIQLRDAHSLSLKEGKP
jgi:hypothetical protein